MTYEWQNQIILRILDRDLDDEALDLMKPLSTFLLVFGKSHQLPYPQDSPYGIEPFEYIEQSGQGIRDRETMTLQRLCLHCARNRMNSAHERKFYWVMKLKGDREEVRKKWCNRI